MINQAYLIESLAPLVFRSGKPGEDRGAFAEIL